MIQQTVYINFIRSIVSPGYLKAILKVAQQASVTQVRFGLRQQLILDIPMKRFAMFKAECCSRTIVSYKKRKHGPHCQLLPGG